MCNCGPKTCIFIVASIFVIIESIIHIGLFITEILLYNCSLEIDGVAGLFITVPYFYQKKCLEGRYLDIIFQKEELQVATRTHSYAIVYITLDCLWILLSFILLFFNVKWEKWWKVSLLSLWNTIAFIEIVLDFVTIGIYAGEIEKINTIQKYKNFTGINTYNNYDYETDTITSLGSLLLIVISCRGLIFLFANVVFFIIILVRTIMIIKDNKPKTNERIVPLKTPKKSVLKRTLPQLSQDNVPRVEEWHKHYEGKNNNSNNNLELRYNNVENKNQMNTTPVMNINYDQQNAIHKDMRMIGNNTNVLINGVESGTLRRQLPWSYVRDPNAVIRKQMYNTDVDFPPVPVPDYTMRLPKNQNIEKAWNQHPPTPYRKH